MDLETWIPEGLVDTIIPYSSSVRLNSYVPAWKDPQDVTYFLSLKGTKCCLALNLMPGELTQEEYRRKAHKVYQIGVEKFFFWDGIGWARKAARLGHREELAAWMEAGQPALLPSAVRLWGVGRMGSEDGDSWLAPRPVEP